jgi:lysosomal acid lipase/cholesteryl ester hydrolase
MDPDTDSEYWDFTFADIATRDVPAVIDFIQEEMKDNRKMVLLGYSQGTTVGAYGIAEMPEYFERKVSFFAALGPAVLFGASNEPGFKELADQQWLQDLMVQLNYLEFSGKHRNRDSDFIAYVKASNPFFCALYSTICDFGRISTVQTLEASPSVNLRRADWPRVAIYLKVRGGTSTKNMIHMAQQYHTDRLTKFNYGAAKNKLLYNLTFPPPVALENIKVPVGLYVAKFDQIADDSDNRRLA